MKFKYNPDFYKQSQFWVDILLVFSLSISHKMIFTSEPVVKYALILSLVVLLVDLPCQMFVKKTSK